MVPFWQSPEKKVIARLNTCLGFPKPKLVPVTQGCYGNRPVPVTESGPVPVTLHCYEHSVPVTSNPRAGAEGHRLGSRTAGLGTSFRPAAEHRTGIVATRKDRELLEEVSMQMPGISAHAGSNSTGKQLQSFASSNGNLSLQIFMGFSAMRRRT